LNEFSRHLDLQSAFLEQMFSQDLQSRALVVRVQLGAQQSFAN